MNPTARSGVTLAELMVVLVILGVMAGVVGLAWRPNPASRDRRLDPIAAARHQALQSGRTVRVQVTVEGRSVAIAALPDGRIVTAGAVQVDPLTGAVTRE
jgi:prepilin-type N-terminal cleavage/methylation domain-containing protein